jgi:uncharacterized phage protein (TIGR01671 family)
MKREIKFRAFHKKSKTMIYFPDCGICDEYSSISFYAADGSCYDGIGRLPDYPNDDWMGYNPFDSTWELMQFTGLKDKNGKEIYEGDIVQRGIITFSRGKFVGQYYGSNGNLYEEWEDDLYQENNIEVIGNIYENPELLKQS